jgi:uncharacterized protein (TIGR02391 family)
MTWGLPLEADKALAWPVDQVAIHILRGFQRGGEQHRHNFLNGALQAYQHNGFSKEDVKLIVDALAEAYDWLIINGLLSGIPGKDDWLFITRKGLVLLDSDDGLALMQAGARLDVDLHSRIASRVRRQFLLGEYELAALAAMREVEIRVRELAGAQAGDIGVALMRQAFKPDGGPLADSHAEKGEQEALSALFAGAIGVFKNPVSHRQVDYADPTLASEVVLLADLLLRILDTTAPAGSVAPTSS